jgi:hypothetical protein
VGTWEAIREIPATSVAEQCLLRIARRGYDAADRTRSGSTLRPRRPLTPAPLTGA